jgi:hypothetical protein
VIVAVGAADRRATAAAWYASRFPAEEHRGVHVATDPTDVHALGTWWMDAGLHRLALEVVDDRGGVAESIAARVRVQLSAGFDEVVVLAGHLSVRGVGRWLLHDHTAEAIRHTVNQIPGAIGVLVPVRVGR